MRQFAKQQNFNPIDRVRITLRLEKQYFARLREKRESLQQWRSTRN